MALRMTEQEWSQFAATALVCRSCFWSAEVTRPQNKIWCVDDAERDERGAELEHGLNAALQQTRRMLHVQPLQVAMRG